MVRVRPLPTSEYWLWNAPVSANVKSEAIIRELILTLIWLQRQDYNSNIAFKKKSVGIREPLPHHCK